MLPWRRHDLQLLPFTSSPDELLDACEQALRAARPRIELVAVTGASNVTGEVWPVAELAEIAHAHGAQLFVDAAQLAPHRPVDMAAAGIDFLAFSGHKLYAPFGAGALVGDARRLRQSEPLLHGGGAIELVALDDVIWAGAPERHEAGSPNVLGVVALAAACRALLDLGMEAVAAHERALAARMWNALPSVPGLRSLTLWGDEVDRVGVATFTLEGVRHPLLAAILSAEHAIGVRHGCFCAHPLITRLLGVPDAEVERPCSRTAGRPAPGSTGRRPGQRRARHDARRPRPADRRSARDRHHRFEVALRARGRPRRVSPRAVADGDARRSRARAPRPSRPRRGSCGCARRSSPLGRDRRQPRRGRPAPRPRSARHSRATARCRGGS